MEVKYNSLKDAIDGKMKQIKELLEEGKNNENSLINSGPIKLEKNEGGFRTINFKKLYESLVQNRIVQYKEEFVEAYKNIKRNYEINKTEESRNKYLDFKNCFIEKLGYEYEKLEDLYGKLEEISEIYDNEERTYYVEDVSNVLFELGSIYDPEELGKYE